MADPNVSLTLSDFFLLRSLLLNESPQWTQDAIFRCHKRGLITQDGTRLTPDGHERASLFNEFVDTLWQGVDINSLTRNSLADHAEAHEDWYRKMFRNDEQYQYSPHVVMFSGGPLPLRYKKIVGKQFGLLMTEWKKKIRAKKWERAIPYAYQAEPRLDGMKTICFQARHHSNHHAKTGDAWDYTKIGSSGHPLVDRIQAQYYDYILQRFPNVSWWRQDRGTCSRDYIGARIEHDRNYMGNGFVAVIKIVKTVNWPYPLFDASRLKKKGTN